jgi:hypothetical protein
MRMQTTTRTRKHLGCSDRSDIDGSSYLRKIYGLPGTRKGIPKATKGDPKGDPEYAVGSAIRLEGISIGLKRDVDWRWLELETLADPTTERYEPPLARARVPIGRDYGRVDKEPTLPEPVSDKPTRHQLVDLRPVGIPGE